jgi:hypothetical protein
MPKRTLDNPINIQHENNNKKQKISCIYGMKCIRINDEHFNTYQHEKMHPKNILYDFLSNEKNSESVHILDEVKTKDLFIDKDTNEPIETYKDFVIYILIHFEKLYKIEKMSQIISDLDQFNISREFNVCNDDKRYYNLKETLCKYEIMEDLNINCSENKCIKITSSIFSYLQQYINENKNVNIIEGGNKRNNKLSKNKKVKKIHTKSRNKKSKKTKRKNYYKN